MKKSSLLAAGIAAVIVSVPVARAQDPQPTQDDQVQEIIVTGQRSGAPMWTVRGTQTTLFLVGSIEGLSKTTRWNPEALIEALRKADRVMFPQAHAYTASPFSLIGWFAKWNAMGSLPRDQDLTGFIGQADIDRLAALAEARVARRDYLRRHPLHLAKDLRDRAKGDVDYGRNAGDYVRRAVKQYKLTLVPIDRSKAKPLVKDLFASTPQEHVPCLLDAITLAEAGPAAVQARSDAWAERRIPAVLASPADRVFASCWPANATASAPHELLDEMKALLAESQVTLAVLGLRPLAEPGGLLDGLEAAGFDIQGPAWKGEEADD